MLFNSNEEKMLHNEKRLKEITLRFERLNMEIEGFLEEMEVTPEQLTCYVENRDNFCEVSWEELRKQKQMLDQKLDLETKSLADPRETQKKRETQNVAPHWLFVR